MVKESKSANEVSPEQINQWIKEHQENKNTDAQDKLVKHYQKLIESLAYKYSKGQSHSVKSKDIYEIKLGVYMFRDVLKKLGQESKK